MLSGDAELDALLREAHVAAADDGTAQQQSNGAAPADGLEEAAVEDLVPPCARGANASIYGYDIATLRERPWQQPGAVLSDYFNYDFDEASYRAYCAMHANGRNSVKLKAEDYVARLFANAVPPANMMMPAPGNPEGQYGTYGTPRAMLPPRPNKTKPCFAFRSGTCTKGDRCYYAHSDEELAAANSAFQLQQAQRPQPSAELLPNGGAVLAPPSHGRSSMPHGPTYQQHAGGYHHQLPPPQQQQQPHMQQPHMQQPHMQYAPQISVGYNPAGMAPSVLPPPRRSPAVLGMPQGGDRGQDDDSLFETPPVPPLRN